MDKPIIKPCPFCGETSPRIKAKFTPAESDFGSRFAVEYHTYFVQCSFCNAKSGEVGGHVIPNFRLYRTAEMPMWATTDDALKGLVADKWNRRISEGSWKNELETRSN